MARQNEDSLFYTAEEVRRMLGVGKTKCYSILEIAEKTGKPFPVVRIGRQIKIPKEPFECWIEQLSKN